MFNVSLHVPLHAAVEGPLFVGSAENNNNDNKKHLFSLLDNDVFP